MSIRLASALVAFGLSATAAAAQEWKAPIGVPAPSFGIAQRAAPAPNPWNAEVAGFYYVDASAVSATDTGNTYGYPARPRRTVPESLPAGAVVTLAGTYSQTHLGSSMVKANGTAVAPVFIRGASAANRARLTQPFHIQ